MLEQAPFELGFVLDGKSVVEKQSDGKLRIEGYAATLGLDRHDEAFLPGVFQKGLDKYFKDNPVLLYHHHYDQALGTVEEVKLDGKGLFVKAALDDPEPNTPLADVYNKVKSGTIKGFSIGGIFKRKMTPQGPRVHHADFAEISVTPLPLEPGSLFALAGKAFGADDELSDALDALDSLFNELDDLAGKAMSAGYPQRERPSLVTPGDVAKAVDRCGEGVEEEEELRAYIIREAEAMDCTNLLPENWLS